MLTILVILLLVAALVVNLVGGKAGVGSYIGIGRPGSWLITLGLLAAALALAGYALLGRWDGILIDQDNRISLSRLQLVLWTIVLVSALLTAGLSNAVNPPDEEPLRIHVPARIWALLGLGAFTAVAAPMMTEARQEMNSVQTRTAEVRCSVGGQPPAPLASAEPEGAQGRLSVTEALRRRQGLSASPCFAGDVIVKPEPRDARWIDLITGDNEGALHVDVSKLQQLAFTLLLISVYVLALNGRLAGVASVRRFPDADTGFLSLLTISHVAYLADLQAGMT